MVVGSGAVCSFLRIACGCERLLTSARACQQAQTLYECTVERFRVHSSSERRSTISHGCMGPPPPDFLLFSDTARVTDFCTDPPGSEHDSWNSACVVNGSVTN